MLLFWESLNNSYLCEAGMLCCRFGNLLAMAKVVRHISILAVSVQLNT